MTRHLGILAIVLILTLPTAVLAQPAEPKARCLLPYDTFLPHVLGVDIGPAGDPPRGAAGEDQADFNGDGCADLAVAAPGQLVDGEPNAGAVYVFPGSHLGINPDDWSEWHQDTPGVPERAEAGDRFGMAMATGTWPAACPAGA